MEYSDNKYLRLDFKIMDTDSRQTQEKVVYLQKWLVKNPAANASTDQDRAFALLSQLNALPITVVMLNNTGIYATVKRYRKDSEDEAVKPFAKRLLKKWKALLKSARAHNSSRKQTRDTNPNGKRIGNAISQSPDDNDPIPGPSRAEATIDPGGEMRTTANEDPPLGALCKRKSSKSSFQTEATRSIEVQTISSGDILGFVFESDFA